MCDICKNESGFPDVGVAAVPAAPVSLMWCEGCLRSNATPTFVAETWLFSEFYYDDAPPMPEEPPAEFPLAPWAGDFNLWMGVERGYVPLRDTYKELWADEFERRKDG